MNGIIFDIERNSFVDGPGIRTTVFFKGCNLKCRWCHNPESQNNRPQIMFYKDKCIGCQKCKAVCEHPDNCILCGKCAVFCPSDARKICGKEYSSEEVLSEIVKDKTYYENSGGGATFSGGECMLQIDFLCELLKKCKENGIHTAVDTAGAVPYEYFGKILPYTDLFLYDVKCITEEKHIEGTGFSNKLILENLKRLCESKDVTVRVPIIPTFNDSDDEITKISEFLSGINALSVEVLPYHEMGINKYNALGMEITNYPVPTPQRMEEIKKILQR